MPEKKGKGVVPRLRFPEFRDAGPWEVKRLGEIADSLTSLSGKTSKDFGHGNALYVPYVNVYENAFVDPNKLERVDIGPNEKQNKIQRGDLLFTVSSETPDEAGMSSVVVHDISYCYVNSFCAIYRPVSSIQLDLTFAGYYLRSPIVRKHFLKTAQGAIRFNLNREAFQKTPVLLPPPPEQQKIADCLSSLDDLIRAEEAALEALKDHKKGLMQQLFPREGETTPRLRFPEFRNAGPWEVKRLGETARLRNGYAFKSSTYTDDGVYQIITIANVQEGMLSLESTKRIASLPDDIQQHQILKPGDILISMTGNVGRVCRVTTESLLLNQRVGKLEPKKNINAEFLYQWLQRPAFRKAMELRAAGGAQGNLSSEDITGSPVYIPKSATEQQKIADCLSSLDDLIRAQTERIEALKQHKKGLMQQLFPQEVG